MKYSRQVIKVWISNAVFKATWAFDYTLPDWIWVEIEPNEVS